MPGNAFLVFSGNGSSDVARLFQGAAFLRWVPLVEPVRSHIRGNVEHANLGEPHLLQSGIGRPDVGAALHGTATAIDHDVGVFAQSDGCLFQRLYSRRRRTWTS